VPGASTLPLLPHLQCELEPTGNARFNAADPLQIHNMAAANAEKQQRHDLAAQAPDEDDGFARDLDRKRRRCRETNCGGERDANNECVQYISLDMRISQVSRCAGQLVTSGEIRWGVDHVGRLPADHFTAVHFPLKTAAH